MANAIDTSKLTPGTKVRYYILSGYKATNTGTIREFMRKKNSTGPGVVVLEDGSKRGHWILASDVAEVL